MGASLEMCFVSLFILSATVALSARADLTRHIQTGCIANYCPYQNNSHGMVDDLWCDEVCQKEHCIAGCNLWKEALNFSCYTSCNSNSPARGRGQSLYCLIGCNYAVTSYIDEVKVRMGRLPVPVVIPNTVTNTSVALRWNWNTTALDWAFLNNSNATAISLQWRYSRSVTGGAKEPTVTTSWDNRRSQWHQEATVTELQPYTSYRFRIVAVLASDREPLTSTETGDITTQEFGSPSTAPTNLKAIADATRVSISWDEPEFANGPIVSYSLRIQEIRSVDGNESLVQSPLIEDLLGGKIARSYVFDHLNPGTNYDISVSAQNAQGQGPSATIRTATLHLEKGSDNGLEPFMLIVAGNRFINRHHVTQLAKEEISIFNISEPNFITGLAVHSRQGLLYVSDDYGNVNELRLDASNRWHSILQNNVQEDGHIQALSVDWLFDRLYLLLETADGTWNIAVCKLSGHNLTRVITGIERRPLHLEVDPFNGYLSWAIKDKTHGGLYIADLADLADPLNAPLSAVAGIAQGKITKIMASGEIVACKVDPVNGRIFVMMASKASIVAVPYSGSAPTTIRHSLQYVDDVSSLAYFQDELFYWINNGFYVYEEIIPNKTEVHANTLKFGTIRHTDLVLSDVKSQPVPTPLTAVRHLEALFGSNSVHVKWDPPALLAHKGRGAWQNWSYRIQVENIESGAILFFDDIASTQMELSDLRPNTTYMITVQPSTSSSPTTSAVFTGRTLPDDQLRRIYWATAGGNILQSSPTGEDVVVFADVTPALPSQSNKPRDSSYAQQPSPVEVISMAWMYETLYVVTNTSRIYRIDLPTRNLTVLDNIEAVSVATDWLARKVYWSSAKRQTIGRSLQDGSQSEWLPIIGIATSLAIHPTLGRIAWCTGHSVEGASLNADQRQSYWSSKLHLGNQAIAMTMDYDREQLYWMVQELNGATLLYRAVINLPSSAAYVGQIGNKFAKGPLQYMSDRLIWLQQQSVMMVVGDLNGTNTYHLAGPKQQHVSSFLVLEDNYPIRVAKSGRLVVVPDTVDASSIVINETAPMVHGKGLLISWAPVSNVNYGTVSYDIRISTPNESDTVVSTSPRYLVPDDWHIPPYTEVVVSIRAFTVWSSANVVEVRRRSPAAKPEAPVNPRTFVSFVHEDSGTKQTDVVVDFRWSPPLKTNGQLTEYKISCWLEKNNTRNYVLNGVTVPSSVTEYSVRHLSPNETYYFTVGASTEVGFGPSTAPTAISTAKETPVPQLLIFTTNSLWLADLDKHTTLNKSLAKGFSEVYHPPIATAFINHDRQLYWFDTLGDLYLYELDRNRVHKIYRLNATANSLAIDWVSRHVYWSQSDLMGISSVYRLDLSRAELGEVAVPQLIMKDNINTIRLVEIDPFTSRLIWLSLRKDGTGTFMTSHLNGGQSRPFFDNPNQCGNGLPPQYTLPLAMGTLTTVDWSDAQRPRLLWLSAANEDIWSSDWKGCQSSHELISLELKRAGGWPPSSLAVDRQHLYWSNATEGRIYKMRRSSPTYDNKARYVGPSAQMAHSASAFIGRSDITAELVADVRKIATLGANSQPMPSNDCLTPMAITYKVELVNSTDTTLALKMPIPIRPQECVGMTMASPRYHIYYVALAPNRTDVCATSLRLCQLRTTMDSIIVLRDLHPFTEYAVRVQITNYYRPNSYSEPVGSAVYLSTEPGVPTKPKNVAAFALSPKAIRVQWEPSSFANGHNVQYHVYWSEVSTPSSIKVTEGHAEWKGSTARKNSTAERPIYTLDVYTLNGSRNYTFWVRAYAVDGRWNQSEQVHAKTYQDPPSLVFNNVSATSVVVKWRAPKEATIGRHVLEMSPSRNHGDWRAIGRSDTTQADEIYEYRAENLTPLTSYSFRLHLEYSPDNTTLTWPVFDNGRLLSFVENGHWSIETRGNAPGRPRSPRPTVVDKYVEIYWGPTATNGRSIDYILEMKTLLDEYDDVQDSNKSEGKSYARLAEPLSHWIPIYNGSEHFFVAHNLTSGVRYQFRVQAVSDMGASEFSEPSDILIPELGASRQGTNSANFILSVGVSVLVALCSVLTLFLFYTCRIPPFKGKKIKGDGSIHHVSGSEMTDLATLRELPQRESFVQQNNAIYGVGDGDLDQEVALLPHIRFEDLSITKFLGRGAFGEVFEGRINNLPESGEIHTRVAVKTLRKGATEQEKAEFLKEALLMSHFKHEHILRLLGVCLDADPNFILLELMEGGDLLSFLRNNRPPQRTPPSTVTNAAASGCQLSLLDLVAMCADVAKGCCYLEELHYVHRDLAARNCLVSSVDPSLRVVKIGDFGLARDIYRNDYYRKEGEGLLPVRWMAPESLMDGVFTCQTDVWSFGVLLWEIMTLGQQPYPARTNLQVLHFVRAGGRLDRPPHCPDCLFELMMSCWSYDPASRPSFTQCLEELNLLHDKLQNSPFNAVHNGYYVGGPVNDSLWQTTHCSNESDVSCAYLEQNSLEPKAVFYTNDVAFVRNGIAVRNEPDRQRAFSVANRLERCSSARITGSRLFPEKDLHSSDTALVRSNSTEGAINHVNDRRAGNDRYLELLSESHYRDSMFNGGYEVPRVVPTIIRCNSATSEKRPLSRSNSTSQISRDRCDEMSDQSCVTDESCIANSPPPICDDHIEALFHQP